MNSVKKLIATGLGTGYLPIAPGTWASAAACAVFLAVAWGSGGRWYCVSGTMLLVAVAASIGCVATGKFAEAAFGRRDPSQCTADEWAGQSVAMLLLPIRFNDFGSALVAAGVAFVLFRMFDIIKPPPARQFERLPAGWGILADDLAAGVYANVTAQLILRLGFHLP